MKSGRFQKRKPQREKSGLCPGEGEALGLSADAPQATAAVSSCGPDEAWLLERLLANGATKPRVHLDKNGVWRCSDGSHKLGTVTAAEVESRDEDAALRLFGMMSAVKMEIVKGPFEVLWGAAHCLRHVRQQVCFDLLRDRVTPGISPMTWVNRRSISLAVEWREETAARAEKRKDKRAAANASVVLGSGVLNFAATRVLADYSRWKARESLEKGPPWATALTFDVKGADVRLSLTDDKNAVVCKLGVLGKIDGHRQEQPEFIVRPSGGSAWANVRAILKSEYEQRSVKVERTVEGRWMLSVAYRRPRPALLAGVGALVVLRSMQRFIVAIGSDGRLPRKKLDGDCLEHTEESLLVAKRRFSAKYREMKNHLEHQGKGARGHGRARFFRILDKRSDAEARYVQTWCQQQAAFIAKQAVEMGYGRIVVEDFAGGVESFADRRFERLLRRFPFYKLKQSILHDALKAGLKGSTAERRAGCPKCGGGTYADGMLRRCADADCGCAGESETLAAWRLCLAVGEDVAGLEARAEREVERWQAMQGVMAEKRERREHPSVRGQTGAAL